MLIPSLCCFLFPVPVNDRLVLTQHHRHQVFPREWDGLLRRFSDALQILHDLLEERGRPPRAILCANDSMASAVCDDLFRRGFRVPENVIVAGFDGISSSYIMQPQLTTCDSNPEELAELVMERILSFDPKLQPPEEPVVLTHTYRTVLTESCGCSAVTHNRFSALKSLQRAKALSVHENSMYYAIDQLLEEKDLYSFD